LLWGFVQKNEKLEKTSDFCILQLVDT